MNRTEIRDLANQARTNPKIARGAFRKLAMENGFVGRSGGWIYRGEGGAVVQGWQGLADLVCYGQVTFTATEERDAQDQRAVEAETELEAADQDETPASVAEPTFKGKTAAEWRAMATRSQRQKAESWERSDTDGFMTQWASDVCSREYLTCADLIEQGGMTEMQVPFVDGKVASTDYREGQYGWYWLLTVEAARVTGSRFFTPSKADKSATRRKNNAKKGVTMGTIRVKGDVVMHGNRYHVSPYIVADEDALRAGEYEVISTDNDTTDY